MRERMSKHETFEPGLKERNARQDTADYPLPIPEGNKPKDTIGSVMHTHRRHNWRHEMEMLVERAKPKGNLNNGITNSYTTQWQIA
jgi:hypothetical protein